MNSSGLSCQSSKKKLSAKENPIIGVIGGSGLCELPGLTVSDVLEIDTPYGNPSGPVLVGEFCGKLIAFLPRHGKEHTIPPHKVPYKANLSALKVLGIQHVISTSVVGSLRKEIEPGTFVIPDQFINFTWGRDDTYEIDRELVHLPMAVPYCEHTRAIIASVLSDMGVRNRKEGTVVVIQGPRFSTIAESRMFALLGGDIVNMTQYPECYFARELGLCYATVATVTDYDVCVPSSISMQQESLDEVLSVFRMNTTVTVSLLKQLVRFTNEITNCNCASHRLAEYYKQSKG